MEPKILINQTRKMGSKRKKNFLMIKGLFHCFERISPLNVPFSVGVAFQQLSLYLKVPNDYELKIM